MLKKAGILFFFIAVAAFQTALAPSIALFGVKPDFILIAVILWGVTFGEREGAFVGFFAGFIEDILSSSFYVHALTNALCGFLASAIKGGFAFSSSATSLLAVSSLTIVNYAIKIVSFYFFFGRQLPGVYSIAVVMLISALYNSALTIVLLPWIQRVYDWFSTKDSAPFSEYTLYRR